MGGEVVAGIPMPEGDPGAVRDAASAFRRVAGGFGHVQGAVGDAVASVPTWQGLAAMQFHARCADYTDAARAADHACDRAASALDGYAGELAEARRKVGRLQDEGRRLLATEQQANRLAEAALGRLRTASMMLRQSAMDAAFDGGAGLQRAKHEEAAAQTELSHQSGRASRAHDERQKLIGRAKSIGEDVQGQARAAAAKVRGAMDDLPTVVGAPSGTVGGTPLSAHTERFEGGVTVLIVHIGGNTAVIQEHTADGKWRVTEIDGVEGGLEFDPVPGAGVDGGKAGRLGAGADVEAAFLAQFKHGRTWEFASKADADRFRKYMDAYVPPSFDQTQPLVHGDPTPEELTSYVLARRDYLWSQRQRPVETFSEGGMRTKVDANFGNVAGGSAEAEQALGTRHDARTGANTRYFRTSASVAGQVGLPLDAGGKVHGEAITAITRDPTGRPTSFSITLSSGAESTGGVHVAGAPGSVAHHETVGTRVERQMTLDLGDPDNRRVVERYLDSAPGSDPSASADLVERLRDHARVDVRHYDTGSTSTGANIDVKVFKAGGSNTTEDSVLTSMRHHAADGATVTTLP